MAFLQETFRITYVVMQGEMGGEWFPKEYPIHFVGTKRFYTGPMGYNPEVRFGEVGCFVQSRIQASET